VQVDLVAFEAAASRGLDGDRDALREAAGLYTVDLVPDCTADWTLADRERLRERARHVLTRLVETLEHDRAFGEAIERAHQLLRIDPLDESACAP
jgi:DNA-binding SARP family transcriptional activator